MPFEKSFSSGGEVRAVGGRDFAPRRSSRPGLTQSRSLRAPTFAAVYSSCEVTPEPELTVCSVYTVRARVKAASQRASIT